jgi:hypothetical protein
MIPIWKYSGRLGNQMFRHAYIYSQYKKGLIPDEYVQSPEYFKDYEFEIKQLFGEGIGYDNRVGIQLRRGDYVGNPYYVNLSETDYYKKAIEMFPNKRFLIFCKDGQDKEQDRKDREWCIEYFTKLMGRERFDFYEEVDNDDPVKALNSFASCSDIIMANGSFSWWAGYLCKNVMKKVIYPLKWYSDGVERTKCPESWIGL